MKSQVILLALFFSFLVPSSPSSAQPAGMKFKPGMEMRQWKMDEQCWKASDLNLSSEQAKALELIQQTHFRETRLLRGELFLKRLELREFLSNPSAKIESIRSKYAELNDLQTKLEEKFLDYLIKIRGLLTIEQLKNWCPEQEIPLFRQMMQGKESKGSKHSRKPFFRERWKED